MSVLGFIFFLQICLRGIFFRVARRIFVTSIRWSYLRQALISVGKLQDERGTGRAETYKVICVECLRSSQVRGRTLAASPHVAEFQ